MGLGFSLKDQNLERAMAVDLPPTVWIYGQSHGKSPPNVGRNLGAKLTHCAMKSGCVGE